MSNPAVRITRRRIEAEINISASSWEDLELMILAVARQIPKAKPADENLYWTSRGCEADAEANIKVNKPDNRQEGRGIANDG